MPKIERKPKDFELRGHVQMVRTGQSNNGDEWCMLSVSGFTFFLDPAWIPELTQFEDGQPVVVKGEYAGDRIRNGQRQPNFEVFEVSPVVEPRVNGHTVNPIPRIEKGAPVT